MRLASDSDSLQRQRPDLLAITQLVPVGSSVLDLGCGDGMLLADLVRRRNVTGRGIEISEEGVLACINRGLSVRQGKLEEGLADYPRHRFDVVILSQTLPFLNDPVMILTEMLRVGRQAIVSFPNWGYWRSRLGLLLAGNMPAMPDLGTHWYDAPRWQAFTIADFAQLCQAQRIEIAQRAYLAGYHRLRTGLLPNLRASTAIFLLHQQSARPVAL
jgi:methionine biosynthesis protein MetW